MSLVYLLLLFHSLKSNLSEILNSPWYMICWARRCIEWSESEPERRDLSWVMSSLISDGEMQSVGRSGGSAMILQSSSCQVLSVMVRCRVWRSGGSAMILQSEFPAHSPVSSSSRNWRQCKSGKSSVVRIMLSAAHNSLCLSQNCSVTDIRGSCNNS